VSVRQKNRVSIAVTRAQGNKEDFLVEERDYRAGNKEFRRELKMKTSCIQNVDKGQSGLQRRYIQSQMEYNDQWKPPKRSVSGVP